MTPGRLLGPINPGLVLLAIDHVELARLEGEIAARIRRDVAVHDLVEHRRAAEILFVGDEAHVLLRLIFGEHERAGADRLFGEAVAHLLRGFLADHIAAVDIGDVAEEAGDRILQGDLQRIGIDSVGAGDAGEIIRIGRRRLVRGALDRIGRVFGGELSVVPMTLHAMSDVEGPFRAGRIGAPTLGEVGLDRVRADLTGLHAHEAVEHILQQALVGRRRGDMRIELPGVGRTHADDEGLLLRLRLARHKEGSESKPRHEDFPHWLSPTTPP